MHAARALEDRLDDDGGELVGVPGDERLEMLLVRRVDRGVAVTVVAPEAEALELHEQIATTLAQLSPRDGELLRAFYLQERDKDEICRDTGLSDTQFRVALFRAKERFRKIYLGGLKRSTSGQH